MLLDINEMRMHISPLDIMSVREHNNKIIIELSYINEYVGVIKYNQDGSLYYRIGNKNGIYLDVYSFYSDICIIVRDLMVFNRALIKNKYMEINNRLLLGDR